MNIFKLCMQWEAAIFLGLTEPRTARSSSFSTREGSSMILLKLLLKIFLVCMYLAHVYLCAPCACWAPQGLEEGHQIYWNWSYEWLGTTVWVLETEPCPLRE